MIKSFRKYQTHNSCVYIFMKVKTTWRSAVVACCFSTSLITTSAIADNATLANDSSLLTEEPLSLSIHFHFHEKRSFYNNEWPVEKYASELTGISLTNVTAKDINNGNEAFNLLRASGDWPDIVGGTGLREKFNQYGPMGDFLPLNTLIEKHAPNIKAFFADKQDLLKSISAADGKLYHIPYVPDGKFGRAYFIRTDWLETLNLTSPETVDELHSVLTAFLNNDPNRNGLKDEIPFFARNFEEMVRLVTLWDARTTGSDSWHDFYISEGNVQHGYVETAYKIGINELAKWYAEGLIDNNIGSDEEDIRLERLSSNRGGMTHDWFASTASYNEKLSDDIDGFAFKPFAPPQSIGGNRVEEHRRSAIKPDGWGITKANESVVDTIRYFDFWFSPAGRRLANFGIEGEHYTLVDGKPVFTDSVLHSDIPVNAKLWSVGAQVPRGFQQDYDYERQWTNKIALEGIDLYEKGDYLLEPFYGVTLNTEEKETFDFYWNTLLTFMLERQEEWIRGTRDVNKDWDGYLVQLDKLGIKKVMKIMQEAYDRQYNSESAESAEYIEK